MKRLFTSYYGAWRLIPQAAAAVQVSNSAPEWFPRALQRALELAPRWMKKAWAGRVGVDDPAWVGDYTAQLEELEASGRLAEIMAEIPDGAVMLCYEKDASTCHRSVLGRFLEQHGYCTVRELTAEPEPDETQLELKF